MIQRKIMFGKDAMVSMLGIVALLSFFVLMSFIAGRYESEINALTRGGGVFGMIVYVFITVLAIIVAPISTVPLIPIASHVWGWFVTAILSIMGWAIGAQIAFYIARHFGQPFVEKIISIEKLEKFKKRFPDRNLFWAVVFFRMVVPVDILSYALGLFSSMNDFSYFLATLLGITPFAFLFAYAGTFSVGFQVIAFSAGLVVVFVGYVVKNFRSQTKI